MISDIKDLKALFKLCRAQGITEFKMNGVEIKFGQLPEKYQSNNAAQDFDEEPDDETLAFWSSDKGQETLDKKVGIR